MNDGSWGATLLFHPRQKKLDIQRNVQCKIWEWKHPWEVSVLMSQSFHHVSFLLPTLLVPPPLHSWSVGESCQRFRWWIMSPLVWWKVTHTLPLGSKNYTISVTQSSKSPLFLVEKMYSGASTHLCSFYMFPHTKPASCLRNMDEGLSFEVQSQWDEVCLDPGSPGWWYLNTLSLTSMEILGEWIHYIYIYIHIAN